MTPPAMLVASAAISDLRRSEPGADGSQQFHVAGAHAAQGEHRKEEEGAENAAGDAPARRTPATREEVKHERGNYRRERQHVRNASRAQIRDAREGQHHADENV